MADLILSDFIIDKDEPEQGIKKLIKIIKPAWNLEILQIEALSGGFSSNIFRCCNGENGQNAVTIRIRRLTEELNTFYITDYLELECIQHFSKLGHFPKIFAIFSNGYCYDYIQGKAMIDLKKKNGFMNDQMLKLFARELIFFHSQRIDGVNYGKSRSLESLKKIVSAPFVTNNKLAPSQEIITNEMKALQSFLESQNSPISIIHGDPHPGNVIWDENTEKLTFVDWEIANVGYQFQDIANAIVLLEIFEMIFNATEIQIVLPKDWENKFLRYYFEAWIEIKGQNLTEKSFSDFKVQIQRFKLFPYLFMTTLPMIVPKVCEDFAGDVNLYLENCMKKYLQIKKDVTGRETFDDPPLSKYL